MSLNRIAVKVLSTTYPRVVMIELFGLFSICATKSLRF